MVLNFKVTVWLLHEAKSRVKSNVLSNLHNRPHLDNNSSENENTFPWNNLVLCDVTYVDVVKSVKKSLTGHRQNQTLIFGVRITHRIRVRISIGS